MKGKDTAFGMGGCGQIMESLSAKVKEFRPLYIDIVVPIKVFKQNNLTLVCKFKQRKGKLETC